MRRIFLSGITILAYGFWGSAFGQTYEDLKRENAELRDKVQTLEAGSRKEGKADEKDQAVIVRYEVATATLYVQMGGKERALRLAPATHVHDINGKHVQPPQRGDVLKPGVKISIVEEGAEIEEISILGGTPHFHDHAHDHANGHDHAHEDTEPYDILRPFSHHTHGEGDDHQHADGEGHTHALGHDRHESVDGYHFFHTLVTEHAYIVREFEVKYGHAKGAGFKEDTFDGEFAYAINNRMQFSIGGPLIFRDPKDEPNAAGIGDLEFGFRFVAFNSERSLFTVGLNVTTPTGDAHRDLGEGHTSVEPVILWLKDLGWGNVIQSEFALEAPVGVKDSEGDAFRYNVALGHTFLSTVHWKNFSTLTPFVEVNGVSNLNGPETGRTVVDLTPGVYWQMGKNDFSFGVSFPVTGDRDFDYQIRLAYFRHF